MSSGPSYYRLRELDRGNQRPGPSGPARRRLEVNLEAFRIELSPPVGRRRAFSLGPGLRRVSAPLATRRFSVGV